MASATFANSVCNKGKSVISSLFSSPEALSSASDKAILFFAENFSMNSDLDASGIYLSTFFSKTNLQLHIISTTPKFLKKVSQY